MKQSAIWLVSLFVAACTSTCGHSLKEEPAARIADPALSPAAACVDGAAARRHIETIIAFGPRHAGTPGLDRTRDYIERALRQAGLSPERHPFVAHTPHPDIGSVELANLSVEIGDGEQLVVLSGHFDGKLIAEGFFAGANDGGSSTGLLLEMARSLARHRPAQKVRIVFFDGEEALVKWSDADSLYGSKNYAAHLAERGEKERITALVNIDMVADPRLRFVADANSTPWVMATLKDTASRLGYGDLFTGPRGAIGDDHQPFVEMGIPAAVLIDLSFGPGWESNAWWHTPDDNLDHISDDSMTATGRIVLESLPALLHGRGTDRPLHPGWTNQKK